MFSYNRIRKISEMFDPNIQTTYSLYDHMTHLEDDMDWKLDNMSLIALDTEFESYLNPDDHLPFNAPASPPPLLNHDCMWSGRCTSHPSGCTGARNRSSCSNKIQPTQAQSTPATTPTTTANTQLTQCKRNSISSTSTPIVSTSLLNVQPMKVVHIKKSQQNNIPAGQSLLRLKNTNGKSQNMISVPGMTTNDFLKDRDQNRPDTPLSLEDDEDSNDFRHSIDIAACTMGSNEMSLINKYEQSSPSPTEIIRSLKQQLEDNSDHAMLKTPSYMPAHSDGLDELINDIKSLSDFENETSDMDDDDYSISTSNSFNLSSTMVKLPMKIQPTLVAHPQANKTTSNNTTTAATVTDSKPMHTDHSYTRCKSRVDINGLGVQTPSDSGK